MKRNRKTKVKTYYLISIICLVVLFTGYGFVFNLSERSKEGKEVKTISLIGDEEEVSEKYNKLFAKLMSYFNIFFKETFKEYEDNGMFDKPLIENNTPNGITSAESGVVASLDNIEIYTNDEYDTNDLLKATVLLANDRKQSFYTVVEGYDIASRLGMTPKQFKQDVNSVNEKYNVILYHTHATEAYNSCAKDNYRSDNNSQNVVKIGSIISDNLNNNGIKATHLKEQNDYPSYTKSYANSKQLISSNLDSDKTNIIIDIHRDGADAESNYERLLESVTRMKMNDSYIATYSIVIGGGNENVEQLKLFANLIKSVSDELYPGLCRGIVIRDGGFFNQQLSDYAILLEIGCHLNSMEEAQKTSNYLSEVLCKAFLKLN